MRMEILLQTWKIIHPGSEFITMVKYIKFLTYSLNLPVSELQGEYITNSFSLWLVYDEFWIFKGNYFTTGASCRTSGELYRYWSFFRAGCAMSSGTSAGTIPPFS